MNYHIQDNADSLIQASGSYLQYLVGVFDLLNTSVCLLLFQTKEISKWISIKMTNFCTLHIENNLNKRNIGSSATVRRMGLIFNLRRDPDSDSGPVSVLVLATFYELFGCNGFSCNSLTFAFYYQYLAIYLLSLLGSRSTVLPIEEIFWEQFFWQ